MLTEGTGTVFDGALGSGNQPQHRLEHGTLTAPFGPITPTS